MNYPMRPPDFVMVGGQHDGKVYLFASKTLTEAELRVEADELDHYPEWWMPRQPPRYRHYVTAEMRDFVQVVADTYAEAFATLFEQWTPEPATRTEIGAQPAITAAPRAIGAPAARMLGR